MSDPEVWVAASMDYQARPNKRSKRAKQSLKHHPCRLEVEYIDHSSSACRMKRPIIHSSAVPFTTLTILKIDHC